MKILQKYIDEQCKASTLVLRLPTQESVCRHCHRAGNFHRRLGFLEGEGFEEEERGVGKTGIVHATFHSTEDRNTA